MNQTKKRLTIINLAISMTDIETIQLQILKLTPLKSDSKIAEILSMLNAQNYAKAQELITTYIQTPNETIVQRTIEDTSLKEEEPKNTQSNEKKKSDEDKALIEEFELFTTTTSETAQETEKELYDDLFLDKEDEPETSEYTKADYDPLLNIEADDIVAENINLDHLRNPDNTQDPTNKEDTPSHDQTPPSKEIQEQVAKSNHSNQTEQSTQDQTQDNNTTSKNTSPPQEKNKVYYQAIPHIENKFNNLYTQYPPIIHSDERYYSVESWLLQISSKGYSEDDIETRIQEVEELKKNNLAEAAQLLIATASTDSLYALFRLSRALYTGDILQKNTSEAVNIIHYLATNEEYPEALCDLAQLYEYGILLKKDTKKAKTLYKEAMHAGIQRAQKHYHRLQEKKRGFWGLFKQ